MTIEQVVNQVNALAQIDGRGELLKLEQSKQGPPIRRNVPVKKGPLKPGRIRKRPALDDETEEALVDETQLQTTLTVLPKGLVIERKLTFSGEFGANALESLSQDVATEAIAELLYRLLK